jgi:pilus assembly protein Flp/PilA
VGFGFSGCVAPHPPNYPQLKREASVKAQGLVEYALILALVAVVVVVVLALLGPAIGNVYETVILNI